MMRYKKGRGSCHMKKNPRLTSRTESDDADDVVSLPLAPITVGSHDTESIPSPSGSSLSSSSSSSSSSSPMNRRVLLDCWSFHVTIPCDDVEEIDFPGPATNATDRNGVNPWAFQVMDKTIKDMAATARWSNIILSLADYCNFRMFAM